MIDKYRGRLVCDWCGKMYKNTRLTHSARRHFCSISCWFKFYIVPHL